MGGTRSFGRSSHADTPTTALTAALVGSGPWVLDGKHKPLFFFGSNRAEGPWGGMVKVAVLARPSLASTGSSVCI